MKNKFWLAASLLMAAFSTAGFTACSSDDDEENSSDVNNSLTSPDIFSPYWVDLDSNKVRLTSLVLNGDEISNHTYLSYSYDESGWLSGFGKKLYSGSNDSTIYAFAVPNSSFTFRFNRKGFEGSRYYGYTVAMELNRDGLISKIAIDGDEYVVLNSPHKPDAVFYHTYNSERELTNITADYVEESNPNTPSLRRKTVAHLTMDFEWQDGNLMKYVNSYRESEYKYDESSAKYSEVADATYADSYTYSYTYSDLPNFLRQFPYYFIGIPKTKSCSIGEELYHCLPVLGLMGVGPVNLPKKAYGGNLTFTLNPNGTIDKELRDDNGYKYTYKWLYNGDTRSKTN